jgi:hypothetical protein
MSVHGDFSVKIHSPFPKNQFSEASRIPSVQRLSSVDIDNVTDYCPSETRIPVLARVKEPPNTARNARGSIMQSIGVQE